MVDQVPSWNVLRGRNYGAAGCAVRGTLRSRDGSGTDIMRFWHEPPDNWRVEDERGVWHVHGPAGLFTRSKEGEMVRTPASMGFGYAGAHPGALLYSYRRWPVHDRDGHSLVPTSPASPAAVSGRGGWEVHLARRDGHSMGEGDGMRVVFDDETGILLACESGGILLELLDFALDPPLPEGLFVWEGPFVEAPDPSEEHARARRRMRDMPVPTPTWWPEGPRSHIRTADPDTGSVVLELIVAGNAELSRWPHSVPEPQGQGAGSGRGFVRVWSDEHWRWRLRSSRQFTDEEFARFVASLPQQEPPPRPVAPGHDPTAGRGVVQVYDGPLRIEYGQFTLEADAGFGADLHAAFHGQANGLCGTAVDGIAYFLTGTHSGRVRAVVELAANAPPVEDGWEEVVEASLVVSGGEGMRLTEWDGYAPVAVLALSDGAFRVRYHVRGMDAAHNGEETPDGSGPDEYKITIWPAAAAPDVVLAQTSAQAAYWHSAWTPPA